MKKMMIIAAFSLLASTTQAQTKTDTLVVIQADSAQNKGLSNTKTSIKLGNIMVNVKGGSTTLSTLKNKKTVSIGFNFTRFDLGFSRYIDQGSFTLSPANADLDFMPAKTSNVGFDFFEFKYKMSDRFRFYIGAGLDWNHIRLSNNVTFQKNQATLTAIQEPISFTKNRLSSRYLRIPIGFDFTQTIQNNHKFHFVLGPEFGFLLNGKVKQISKERGKEKFKDDYNFNSFRYGGFVRVGYKGWGIYTKYYFNDVFAKNQGPADFKNMSFGLTWGF